MGVNPRQARDFAKAMGFLSKTGAIDARILSHFAQTLTASDRRERLLMKRPEANQEALQAWVTRRGQLIQMRVAEENRVALSNKTQRKSIAAIRKVLDKERACIDIDIDDTLKEHFADKLALLKGFKGVGPGTQGGEGRSRLRLPEAARVVVGWCRATGALLAFAGASRDRRCQQRM
jgi:transposase